LHIILNVSTVKKTRFSPSTLQENNCSGETLNTSNFNL
jgi:hypothetical protein